MNPFDSYMLNKVRRLKDVRTRYAATGARRRPTTGGTPVVPVGRRATGGTPVAPVRGEFVTGAWPSEFERILNGESASMLAQDAQLGKL